MSYVYRSNKTPKIKKKKTIELNVAIYKIKLYPQECCQYEIDKSFIYIYIYSIKLLDARISIGFHQYPV